MKRRVLIRCPHCGKRLLRCLTTPLVVGYCEPSGKNFNLYALVKAALEKRRHEAKSKKAKPKGHP